MSRYFSGHYAALTPYTPGEQPQDRQYIKLNTNESPFPPAPAVLEAVKAEAGRAQLYCDPDCRALREEMARVHGVSPEMVVMVNGSDEALNFAFMAFADEASPLAFADITYGFYPVYAELNHIPYEEIPLREDFSVNPADYCGMQKTIVLANPNAPTGLALPLAEIENICKSNPEHIVIVDEAYVAFGSESAVTLLPRCENLLVIGTFSKSHSLAGARLGYAIGSEELIADLNTLRYSTNPYNVNRMTAAAGIAALKENEHYLANCRTIMENREWTAAELKALGFTMPNSQTNFLFAKSDAIDGEALYLALKQRGILVRHFTKPRIAAYNRITIGTREQMEALIGAIKEILKESAQ